MATHEGSQIGTGPQSKGIGEVIEKKWKGRTIKREETKTTFMLPFKMFILFFIIFG